MTKRNYVNVTNVTQHRKTNLLEIKANNFCTYRIILHRSYRSTIVLSHKSDLLCFPKESDLLVILVRREVLMLLAGFRRLSWQYCCCVCDLTGSSSPGIRSCVWSHHNPESASAIKKQLCHFYGITQKTTISGYRWYVVLCGCVVHNFNLKILY